MIADIANELHRVRRKLRGGILMEQGARALATDTVKTTAIPEWMIDKALRVEVNEYEFLSSWYASPMLSNGNSNPPTEIAGVRVYAIGQHFPQLPAPGWRIINPFDSKPIPNVPDYGSPFMKTPA